MTTIYELNEKERQIIDAMRSNQVLDNPETPSVKKEDCSHYSYEQRIAFAVFAKLALEGVFDAKIIDSIQLHYVVGFIEDAITDTLKDFGAEVGIQKMITHSQELEFYKRPR